MMRRSRRTFLKAGAAAALSGPSLFAQSPAPARKLRIAGIGVGGMGRSNIQVMAGEEIVALCDVDHKFAAPTFQKFPQAKVWKDFREMLAKQDDIEAVMIATPDHTHAMIAMAALKAGKHVYCQKPLTHDIWEGRELASAYAAAREKGCVAVMGNQYHSSAGARKVVEWVRGGVIGEVKRVVAWCSLNYRPFGNAPWATLTDKPPVEHSPVPDTLDWEAWLGPAQVRPYHPTYHPARWRAWWDFGCGMMGDRGVHTLDASVWALDLTAPTSIECLSIDGANEFVHPDKAHVRYQFPARGSSPPVQLDWYSGNPPPDLAEITGGRKAGDDQGGAVIIGSRGMISHGTYPSESLTIFPDELKQVAVKVPSIPPVLKGSHEAVWIAACKGEGPVSSDFEYAAKLTEVTLLGNLAIRMGGRIDWDSAACKSTNRPEAADLIRPSRRSGWELG